LSLGGGFVWLLLRQKEQQGYARAKAESEPEKATLAERIRLQEARLKSLEELVGEKDARATETSRLNSDLQANMAGLQTKLEEERKAANEKIELLNDAQTKLSDAFKALSAEALKSNNQSFLDLAKATLEKFQESARGDLEKRQQAITELVKPVRDSLERVDTKIQELEKSRVGAYEGLVQQVRSLADSQLQLRTETSNLVKALRSPTVRGRWAKYN